MERNCPESIERKIWPYIDRELSAREVAEISLHLKSCESCNRLFRARSREASLYRHAFVESPFGDAFAGRFEQAFADSLREESDEARAAELFTFNPPMEHRRLAVIGSVAAIALVVFLGVALRSWHDGGVAPGGVARPGGLQSPAAGSEDDSATGKAPAVGEFVTLVRGDDGFVAQSLEDVQRRDTQYLQAGYLYGHSDPRENISVLTDDRSSLSFQPEPWAFAVERQTRSGGAFEGTLHFGSVFARVTHRSLTTPFILHTPNARVKVVGTEFTVTVSPLSSGRVRTTVVVNEGTVELEFVDEDGVLQSRLVDAQSGAQSHAGDTLPEYRAIDLEAHGLRWTPSDLGAGVTQPASDDAKPAARKDGAASSGQLDLPPGAPYRPGLHEDDGS